jgi:hypothetical protein
MKEVTNDKGLKIKTDKIKHVKVKDKAAPLQAWSGPEGSRKLKN